MQQRVKELLLVTSLHYLSAYGEKMNMTGWNVSNYQCPKQKDGHSCGVFLLYFATCVVKGKIIQPLCEESAKEFRYFIVNKLFHCRVKEEKVPNSNNKNRHIFTIPD